MLYDLLFDLDLLGHTSCTPMVVAVFVQFQQPRLKHKRPSITIFTTKHSSRMPTARSLTRKGVLSERRRGCCLRRGVMVLSAGRGKQSGGIGAVWWGGGMSVSGSDIIIPPPPTE